MGEGIFKESRSSYSAYRGVIYLLTLSGLALIGLGIGVLTNRSLVDWIVSAMSIIRGVTSPDWVSNVQLSGIEAVVVGAIVIACGVLVLPRWRQIVCKVENKESILSVTALVALIALWLPVVLIGRSAIIGGERYWWLGDDAMISMRYARNLATGLGLVWNPGERVEGYTNFLWTIYMAVLHWLPIPASKISLFVLLTDLVLAGLTIPLIIRLGKNLGAPLPAVIGGLGAFVLSRPVMYWASYGFETTLLSFLFLLGISRVLEESKRGRPTLLTYFVIAAMPLARADALVLSGLIYCLALLLNSNKKLVLAYSALSMIMPLAHELFRIYYYGDILPNTAYLKTTNWNGKYMAGASYVINFAFNYIVAIGLAVAGVLISKSRVPRMLLGAFFVYMLYVVSVGGDNFPYYRFFVPFVPLLILLAFIGVYEIKHFVSRSSRILMVALCLATMPLIIPGYVVSLLPYLPDVGNVEIGLYLKENSPITSKVAAFWAGSVIYFSERPAIDLLGKSDPYIARLPAVPGINTPGHNKFDFEYSIGVLKPDYVMSDFKLPVTEEQIRASGGNVAFDRLLYFDRAFREHCLSNPVPVDTWQTIFACHWASY